VREELGISMYNIRYSGSGPRPFPDVLMAVFTADFARQGLVIENNEIDSAFCPGREHLPRMPEILSFTRAVIHGGS
jgi:NADH pyrophosphatase NudC (nudix superfamily)